MKTMKVVLFATMLLAGTSAFAQRNNQDQDNRKNDKQKTESRADSKKDDDRHSDVKSSDSRRSDAKESTRSRENREINYSDRGHIAYSERDNRRDSDKREYAEHRNPQSRERGNDRREARNDRRDDRRSRDYDNRRDDNRSVHFDYNHRERHDDCLLCYRPRMRNGFSVNYTISDLARLETNRLAFALDLSDRQIDKIYRINVKYLSHRSNDYYSFMERRERAIRNVLRRGQVEVYEDYLNHMDENDFCQDCHAGWGNGRFRIAFNINL